MIVENRRESYAVSRFYDMPLRHELNGVANEGEVPMISSLFGYDEQMAAPDYDFGKYIHLYILVK